MVRSVATIIKMWNNTQKVNHRDGEDEEEENGKVRTCRRNEFLSFSKNLSILRDLSRCSSSSGVNRSLNKCVNTSEQQFLRFLPRDIFLFSFAVLGGFRGRILSLVKSLPNHITF